MLVWMECNWMYFPGQAVINSTITPNMMFTKTSQKFGQWSDMRANTVYGLGFSTEAELNKVKFSNSFPRYSFFFSFLLHLFPFYFFLLLLFPIDRLFSFHVSCEWKKVLWIVVSSEQILKPLARTHTPQIIIISKPIFSCNGYITRFNRDNWQLNFSLSTFIVILFSLFIFLLSVPQFGYFPLSSYLLFSSPLFLLFLPISLKKFLFLNFVF